MKGELSGKEANDGIRRHRSHGVRGMLLKGPRSVRGVQFRRFSQREELAGSSLQSLPWMDSLTHICNDQAGMTWISVYA